MKYLKTFQDKFNESMDQSDEDILKEPQKVIDEYCEKYPEHETFFRKFGEHYHNRKDFDENLWDYIVEYDEDDNEDNEEDEYDSEEDELDSRWSPESEVYMLEQEIGNFPGSDIWVEFFNAINDSWFELNKIQKYNL